MHTMNFDSAVWYLLRRLKTHGEVANHLEISACYYSLLRNRRRNINKRMKEHVIRCGIKAREEIEAMELLPTSEDMVGIND